MKLEDLFNFMGILIIIISIIKYYDIKRQKVMKKRPHFKVVSSNLKKAA